MVLRPLGSGHKEGWRVKHSPLHTHQETTMSLGNWFREKVAKMCPLSASSFLLPHLLLTDYLLFPAGYDIPSYLPTKTIPSALLARWNFFFGIRGFINVSFSSIYLIAIYPRATSLWQNIISISTSFKLQFNYNKFIPY